MGKHAELYDRHRAVLPGWAPVYYKEPIALVDGDGRWVTDAEGNRYLDFFGGILVTLAGYYGMIAGVLNAFDVDLPPGLTAPFGHRQDGGRAPDRA